MGNGQLIVPGTTIPAHVLAGDKFSAGTYYGAAGTMPNNGALGTITPTTTAHPIAAGYTTGGTVAGDANLVAANILSGKSIFGVAGIVVAGTSYATGTATSGASTNFTIDNGTTLSMYPITVSGLTFTPSRILITRSSQVTSTDITIFDVSDNLDAAYPGIPIWSVGASTGVKNVSPANVTATGFTLPVNVSSVAYKWYAYQ